MSISFSSDDYTLESDVRLDGVTIPYFETDMTNHKELPKPKVLGDHNGSVDSDTLSATHPSFSDEGPLRRPTIEEIQNAEEELVERGVRRSVWSAGAKVAALHVDAARESESCIIYNGVATPDFASLPSPEEDYLAGYDGVNDFALEYDLSVNSSMPFNTEKDLGLEQPLAPPLYVDPQLTLGSEGEGKRKVEIKGEVEDEDKDEVEDEDKGEVVGAGKGNNEDYSSNEGKEANEDEGNTTTPSLAVDPSPAPPSSMASASEAVSAESVQEAPVHIPEPRLKRKERSGDIGSQVPDFKKVLEPSNQYACPFPAEEGVDGSCARLLEEKDVKAHVRKHCKKFKKDHPNDGNALKCPMSNEDKCQWGKNQEVKDGERKNQEVKGGERKTDVNYGFPRHIAEVHLKIGKSQCSACGKFISRSTKAEVSRHPCVKKGKQPELDVAEVDDPDQVEKQECEENAEKTDSSDKGEGSSKGAKRRRL